MRALALSVLLAGCTTASPEANTQAPPAPSSAAPAPPPPRADGKLEGSWKSNACGARKYRRDLKLEAGGRFESLDLVSPCPQGAVCVWSGIVDRKGTWKLEGATVRLTVEGEDPKQGTPLPPTLGWSGGVLSEGDGACAYVAQ